MKLFNDLLVAQRARPHGLLTGPMSALLNRGNRLITAHTLDALDLPPGEAVLEVGFGGGVRLDMVLAHEPRAAGPAQEWSTERHGEWGAGHALPPCGIMHGMRHHPRLLLALAIALALPSCSDGSSLPPLPDEPATTLGVAAGRPAAVRVPSDYDPNTEYPLVVLLHGYSAAGGLQNLYFGLSNLVTALGFILVIPDGTVNSEGARFWNATEACCNFEDQPVDDVAYLRGLIAEAQANYRIDPRGVYLFGHSNGGFMAHRMACEASDVITAIVSLAGSTYLDPAVCTPERPVSMLQIHGTADSVIRYDGSSGPMGIVASGYPSAPETTLRSAALAGCDPDRAVVGDDLDLDISLAGAETQVLEYSAGCERGVEAALWTIEGGQHLPVVDRMAFSTAVIEWLLAQRR